MNESMLNRYLIAAVVLIGIMAIRYARKLDASRRHNKALNKRYEQCLLTRDRFYDERQEARLERDALALHVKNMESAEINRLCAEIEGK